MGPSRREAVEFPARSKGNLKLIDFGLAVRSGTEVGDVTAGTVTHLAPEQASGAQVDPRADMFALGVTLYEWLFGETPVRSRGRGGRSSRSRVRCSI
jgi:serine/threonine protein kinase